MADDKYAQRNRERPHESLFEQELTPSVLVTGKS